MADRIGGRAACRSCGAGIRWALTAASGALIPLDELPVVDGNLAVTRKGNGDLIARVLKQGEAAGPHERRGTSHFVTCPNANAHRRRGTGP